MYRWKEKKEKEKEKSTKESISHVQSFLHPMVYIPMNSLGQNDMEWAAYPLQGSSYPGIELGPALVGRILYQPMDLGRNYRCDLLCRGWRLKN